MRIPHPIGYYLVFNAGFCFGYAVLSLAEDVWRAVRRRGPLRRREGFEIEQVGQTTPRSIPVLPGDGPTPRRPWLAKQDKRSGSAKIAGTRGDISRLTRADHAPDR